MLRIFTIIFFLLAFVQFSCIRDSEEGEFRLQAGEELPAFSVTLNDGTVVTNETLSGKVSVLVFFNTGCPDCKKELPVIQEVYEAFKGYDDISLIAISREQGYEDVLRYWSLNGLTIPFSAQTDRAVYNKFSDIGIPLIFVAGRDRIIYQVWGDKDFPDRHAISAAIELIYGYSPDNC